MKTFILLAFTILFSCNSQKDMTEPAQNLHDIWALKAMNGNEVNSKDFEGRNKQPVLEIFVSEKRIGGNDGCNTIFGSIINLDGSSISFGKLGGTKMACPNMKLSSTYNTALQNVSSYKIEKLHLYLFDAEGNEILKYIKID